MPGLVRGMARTAAIVGTAQATRNAVNRHSAEKDAAAYTAAMNSAQAQAAPPPQQYAPPPEAYAPPPAQAAPPPAAPPAAPAGMDLNSQLMQLAQLHTAGVLTDEEFAQAKAKVLAGG